ncbi:hypothetical protein PVAND_016514 [Polypedilum vanderplanki]|uniref:Uncharacterized protein n=1 Tax=Polypedilum vanderplanki TaxID=319348 RepID=A0A9J6BFA7_POLVA|nr:hypothetical protein PVAND_016514 [Polypedilum vanderplanki]
MKELKIAQQVVEVSLFRKVSNFFRPMFPLPKIKWCEFINNKATKMSPVLSMITVSLKPHAPQFFEACPFTGDVYVNGLSTPTSVNTWLPKGNYKFTVHIYNNEDSLIIGAAIIMIRDN